MVGFFGVVHDFFSEKKKKIKCHSAVSILRERATDIYPSRRNDGVGIVGVRARIFQ